MRLATFPKLYPILDVACLPNSDTRTVVNFAEELAGAGVTLIQYRNKTGSSREMLSHARELKRTLGAKVVLIMNDRADLCLAAGFDGVHLGQDDLSPDAARRVMGADLILGVSTHNPEQFREAAATSASYLAIGPVFATASKANPDPIVGLEGLRRVRNLLDNAPGPKRPLVAIGGIARQTCLSAIQAGADAVAVIADLLDSPRKRAEEFLSILA